MGFKVGDKVKVLSYDGEFKEPKYKIGSVGTIQHVMLGYIDVVFEECDHWWFDVDELELVEGRKTKDKHKLYNGAEAIALAVAGKYLEPISGFGKPFYIYYDKKQKTLMYFNIDEAKVESNFRWIHSHQWKVISPPMKSPKFLIGDYVITNEHDIGKITKVYSHVTHVTYDVSFNGRTAVNYNEELLTLA